METIQIIADETCEKITIQGCSTRDEARQAAIEWCDENNCILVEIKQQEGIFVGDITSDDY